MCHCQDIDLLSNTFIHPLGFTHVKASHRKESSLFCEASTHLLNTSKIQNLYPTDIMLIGFSLDKSTPYFLSMFREV